METRLTTQELQKIYLAGENDKILQELFGEDKVFFDFELYKEKSKWDNKSFNPLHELIDLAEFITESTAGLSNDEKEKTFKMVLDKFEASV